MSLDLLQGTSEVSNRCTKTATGQDLHVHCQGHANRVEMSLLLHLRQQTLASLLSLDQSKLFVLCLTPPGPLRRHVNALVFFLVALFFRLVHGGRLVLSRAVYSVQNEWRGPGVDKLMLRTSWDDDKVTCLDILVFASYERIG